MSKKLENTFKYYNAWNKKNLIELSDLLAEASVLYDWERIITGKDNVINAFKQLFGNLENSIIHMDDYAENDYNVFTKLSVMIDSESQMNCLDVLTFNDHNLIVKIQAYKQ